LGGLTPLLELIVKKPQFETGGSEEGTTKNSRKQAQHQTPSNLSFGTPRSFILSFFQTPDPGSALLPLYN